MIVSTKGRYALAVMMDLAEHNTGEYLLLDDIASRKGISEKYLEGIMEVLSKGGVVLSLRGRGGGGYPAGRKWEQVSMQASDTKYIVCNGDEGDPGAFMDRSIMEGDPHRMIEGMMIAAFATGAHDGYTPCSKTGLPAVSS
jgi:NADH:ubiquinone oxidoreductase subunit F (NADH-binding)